MQNESADLIQEDEVCVIDCSNRSEPDMFASQFEMNESPCFDFRYQLSQRHFEQEQIGWEISQTRGAPETEISQLESIKIAQENATEKQENGKGAALEMLQVYSSPTEDKQQPEIEANENFADKNTNDLISEYIAQAKRIDELLKVIIFERLELSMFSC